MRVTDAAQDAPAAPAWVRGFQFIRVVAALTVVALHLGWVAHAPTAVARLVYPVEWFFVLSGFLTVQQTMTSDAQGWRTSASAYLRRRILRVVPAYIVFVVVASAIAASTAVVIRWPSIKLAAIFSYDIARRGETSPIFDHLWSIGVEVKFYVLWALLIWLVGPRLATRVSMVLCLGCLVVLWALPYIAEAEQWRAPRRIFIPAVGAICLGQIVATLARSRHEAMRSVLSSSWILCAAVPLLLTPLVATTNAAIALGGHFCGIALVVQWIASHQRNRVVIAIDAAPVRWLGDLSYSIYLWQGLFLTTGPAGATDWFQRWPVNALLILPAAAASYYLVERPFLRQRHPGVIG